MTHCKEWLIGNWGMMCKDKVKKIYLARCNRNSSEFYDFNIWAVEEGESNHFLLGKTTISEKYTDMKKIEDQLDKK